jgi:glycosyltransferase involved in cell wall biosynthesis
MDASIILCTYNRCESLRRTLETFLGLAIPEGWTWELIVVDNNSPDATRAVCDEFIGRLPLRYLFEGCQGKVHALASGIEAARSDLLLFTDDDVNVDAQWLVQTVEAARRHPDADFLGGKIIPRWEEPPPSWLAELSKTTLAGVAVHYDHGDDPRFLEEDEEPFFGANLTIRRRVFQKGFGFRQDIGPRGNEPTRQEETDLLKRLMEAGLRGYYEPRAIIYHCNAPDRMTERYMREWFIGDGICRARRERIQGPRLFGAPVKSWAKLLSNGIKYGVYRWTRSHHSWVRAERKMATSWGVIVESRRQTKRRPASAS